MHPSYTSESCIRVTHPDQTQGRERALPRANFAGPDARGSFLSAAACELSLRTSDPQALLCGWPREEEVEERERERERERENERE